MARSANLEVMTRAARAAARHLTRDFNEVEQLQVSIKGPGDFVSAADRRAEQVIHDELKRAPACADDSLTKSKSSRAASAIVRDTVHLQILQSGAAEPARSFTPHPAIRHRSNIGKFVERQRYGFPRPSWKFEHI